MNALLAMLVGVFSQAQPVTPGNMRFTYEPVEGEAASACEHKQIQDLPDWRVRCETPFGLKTFTAHVVVREYPKQGATGLEILYWVTEPGDTPSAPHKFHSTSALLNLKGNTGIEDFSLSQGVENDLASLVLSWGGALK